MPTYEYRCEAGHEFERFQRISEPPVDRCPTCDAPVERLLSGGGGLLFKGSGFYITDYRTDSYRKAAAAESGDSGGKADGAKTPAPETKSTDTKSGGSAAATPKSD